MKKLLIAIIVLIAITGSSQAQEPEQQWIFDSLIVPMTEDGSREFIFHFGTFQNSFDSGMLLSFDVYKMGEREVYCTVIMGSDSTGVPYVRPMVWLPEPKPCLNGDVNMDGVVNFRDVYALMGKLFKLF